MKELFFSLVSRKLFIVLLESGKVIKIICEDNYRQHSENFLLKIREIFAGLSFSIYDLNRIFFLTGPGGQTGERISFSFVLGSILSNPAIKIFLMDSLTFQAASSAKCLSVISIGEKNKRYHFATYQDKRIISEGEKFAEEEFEIMKKKFVDFMIIADFEAVDFLHNFLISKNEFKAFGNKMIT